MSIIKYLISLNIANKITIGRILLTFFFVLFASMNNEIFHKIAFTILIIAGLSDFLDGYLARKYNMITDFGKLMDPLADKILITAGFCVLVEKQIIPAWIAILILAREFAVTGLRMIAATKGKVIAAASGGKLKTMAQGIALIFAGLIWINITDRLYINYLEIVLYITVIITMVTGINYFIKNQKIYLT